VVPAAAQALPSAWSWETTSSHVPRFAERDEDCKETLVVEVLFRNNQVADQELIMAKEQFQAIAADGKPLKILGPIFRIKNLEGAKDMAYLGERLSPEILTEGQGASAQQFMRPRGAIKVIVGGGQTYKQRILLLKPETKSPWRLKFNDFPELEVSLPK